jgi:hypothetical protein
VAVIDQMVSPRHDTRKGTNRNAAPYVVTDRKTSKRRSQFLKLEFSAESINTLHGDSFKRAV